jgi:hypothetical protein
MQSDPRKMSRGREARKLMKRGESQMKDRCIESGTDGVNHFPEDVLVCSYDETVPFRGPAVFVFWLLLALLWNA